MAKKYLFLLFIGFLILAACRKDKPTAEVEDTAFQAILDEKLKPYKVKQKDKDIGMGIYIKGEDEDLYITSGWPANKAESIYFRGARTKIFTAVSILKLQQQGKLNLDATLASNIPGTNEPYLPNDTNYNIPYKDVITIRQLLNHRAGVFDVTNTPILSTVKAPYAGENYAVYLKKLHGKTYAYKFEDFIRIVAKHKLSYFSPNTSFHYSNTGYHLLDVIIARVSGKAMYQFLEDEFLKPLDMKNTFFNVSSQGSESQMVSTPRDLSSWYFSLFGSREILDNENLEVLLPVMATNEDHLSYGFGTQPAYVTATRYDPGTKKMYLIFSTFMGNTQFKQQTDDMDAVVTEFIQVFER